MNDINTNKIFQELEYYKKEKERIRNIIGNIGGSELKKNKIIINIIFISGILFLILFDVLRYIFKFNIPLPQLFSIQLGLLLISIKIIWMIHNQIKVDHFQFWILNSIEFRLNNITNKIHKIEKKINKRY